MNAEATDKLGVALEKLPSDQHMPKVTPLGSKFLVTYKGGKTVVVDGLSSIYALGWNKGFDFPKPK